MEVGAALFALRQIVGNPLARLMTAINAEKAGKFRQAIGVETMDEMGQVITSFNEMMEQQEAYEAELAQQARMESELGIGRDLQLAMVPRNFSEIAGNHPFTIWAELLPAREVGGNFYDAFFLDDNQFCFCIGDVADKGVPAALYMAVAKTLTRAFAKGHDCPSSAVTKVNDELCQADNKGMFASLFLAVLDIRTGRLRYTNAGHTPPFLLGKGKKAHGLSARNGPVVGAIADVGFSTATVLLAPEDLLLLYTDGVTEAQAPNAAFFGEDKLKQLLLSKSGATAKDLAKSVLLAVKAHEADGDRTDDVTLLALRFDGQSNPRWTGTYPAQVSALQDLFVHLSDALFDQSDNIVSRAKLLVAEVASNAVKHGHRPDKISVSLEARVEVADTQTLLTITDNAPAFDPDEVPQPNIDATLEDRPIGGLGLLLVREVSDAFRYVRDGEHNIYRILLCDPNPPFEVIQSAKAS